MTQLTFEIRTSGTVVSTVNLNDGDTTIITFVPTTSAKDTVTESADLFIEKSSAATLKTTIQAIESALDFAEKHPTGVEGVWVTYSPDATTAYQSRLLGGSLLLDTRDGYLFSTNRALAKLAFIRQPYWEQKAATTLELSNGSVTDGSVAPITNCQDGSNDLYVEIDSDQVTGVLQTPAILEFTSTTNDGTGDATYTGNLLVGVIHGDGDSTLPTPGTLVCEGIGQVDAACSGGQYDDLSWADTAENQLVTWTLASGSFLHKKYRAVARLQASVAYTDLWLKLKLLSGSTEIAETRWMLVGDGEELVVIGSLTIPPYTLGQALDLGNLTLGLYEKRASGSGALNLDYILLMPQDSWRRYGAISGLAYNQKLIDNPVDNLLYTDDGTSGYTITNKIDEGGPLMLRPDVKNYLYFLQEDTDGLASIDRSANITIKIHPRRLSI